MCVFIPHVSPTERRYWIMVKRSFGQIERLPSKS